MAGLKMTGTGWRKLDRALRDAPKQIADAKIRLTKSEAVFFAGEIKRGLENQSPGGRKLKPLSGATIAARRASGVPGDKALVGTGALLKSIQAKRISGGGWFAGIFDKGMARIGQIHEEGAGPYVIKMTPRMRAFLFGVVLKQAARRRGASSGGSGGGTVTIRIPPRPFVQPVFRQHGRRNATARRLMPQYARIFRGTMGRA